MKVYELWEATSGYHRADREPPQGTADGDVALFVETAEEAQALYDFLLGIDTGVPLLAEGEVSLLIDEAYEQYSLVFPEMVARTKPEIIAALIDAYGEVLEPEEVEETLAYLSSLEEANPYHDTGGLFTSKEALLRAKKGSLSIGKRRQKVSGKSKKAVKFVATKTPCGRKGREQGTNYRCFDGKSVASQGWMRSAAKRMLSKAKGKKKNEALQWNDHDRLMLERIVTQWKRRHSPEKPSTDVGVEVQA